MQAASRELVQQRSQPGPIGRLEPDPLPVELAVEHRELVTQAEDLRVLVPVTARQQPQQCEHVRDPQIRQSKQHKATSSRSHQRRSAVSDLSKIHNGSQPPWQPDVFAGRHTVQPR